MQGFYESENDDTYKGTEEQIRRVCKKRLIAMFFAKSTQKQSLKVQEILKQSFLKCLKGLISLKMKPDMKSSHISFFQIEACFVVDVVARNFNRKYWKNAPIFTLHDCLITTFDYLDKLEQVFKDSFVEYLGRIPKTEVKEW